MNELVWIAIPSGVITNGKATVQVVVVPRLAADGLPELGNWAKRVLASDFAPKVLVNGRVAPHKLASTPRGDIWEEFFPASTAVAAWQAPPPRGAETFVVRPSGAEEDDLITAYAAAAADIDNPAVVSDVITRFSASRRADPRASARLAPARPPRPRPVIPDRPPADFHEIVAGLRDHPVVLRALGLIFDLVIDAPPAGRGQVSVSWSVAPIPVSSPVTAYLVEGGHFLPAPPVPDREPAPSVPDREPAPSDDARPDEEAGLRIADGMVDVGPVAGWRLAAIDIDHGMTALDAAEAAGKARAMPAMRSSGISLLHTRRSANLKDLAGRSQRRSLDLGNDPLDAHDLILGFRLDARIEDGTWFPLGARRATHTVNHVDIVRMAPDDGHIKPFSLTREGDQLSTDEIVARWSGWGLGFLRPYERGSGFEMQSYDQQSQEARRQPDREAQEFEYEWEFSEPDGPTQLPLRFGQAYEMRLRIADLAGGGLGIGDPVNSLESNSFTYLRLEPVSPPSLVTPEGLLVPSSAQADEDDYRQEVLGPGGAFTTLVVRSDVDQSAARFAADHPTYPDNSSRLLLPPDTTLAVAEQHGRLDGPIEDAERVFRRGLGLDGEPPLSDPMSDGVRFDIAGTTDGSSVPWPGTWPDRTEVTLTVEPLPPGLIEPLPASMAAATDHDGGILVRLPQGEAVDLELRSLVQDTDHGFFQVNTWLAGTQSDLNRNSLLAPATTLRLVHAVPRPLLPPSGLLTAERDADSSIARLIPTKRWFGLHRPSTVQVLATATWDEWGDDDQPVAMGQATLAPLTVPLDHGPMTLVHDLRDTRRRAVTYHLEAVGRHREFFHPADLAEDLVVASTLPPTEVPNSGKPPPIDVRNVVPSFHWEGPTSLSTDGELTLVRQGSRLRVELAAPWYATGVGEQLGVVMHIPDLQYDTEEVLTELARDPIWGTDPPQFVREGMAAPEEVDLAESLDDVHVVGFPVFRLDRRWYADVVLPVTAYSPLVRLALARYQPLSVPGRHISTLTYTDWLPLLPDRTLRVNRQGGRVKVTLAGMGPEQDRDPLVTVCVEQRPAGSSHHFTSVEANEQSAWTRVGAPSSGRLDEEIVVELPAPVAGALRLVVMEAERHGGPAPSPDLSQTLTNRTTYLAQVALSE